jgi:ribonucleoside-diphosphate reductase alpha chain
MCEPGVYSKTDDVITFPVSAPNGAILRKDIDAMAHFRVIKLVQDAWVMPGQRHTKYTKCHHNVSNTVTFQPPATTLWGKVLEFFNEPEWKKVRRYIWENRSTFTGVSLLQQAGDKIYQQAPREEVLTDEDVERWNNLNPIPVDFSQLIEDTDDTHLAENLACSGGMCEIQ